MVPDVNLKEIQRKVYTSYFQDGLWDIMMGIFPLSWGLMIHFDMPWLAGGLFIGFYFLVLALKRYITYPRIGYAKVAETQKHKARILVAGIVVLMLGLAIIPLFVIGNPPDWLGQYVMFIFGCIIAAVIALLAFWWKANHWYAYSMVMVAGVSSHQWFEVTLDLSFIVPGTIIVFIGIAILVHFLSKYPKIDQGALNEGR